MQNSIYKLQINTTKSNFDDLSKIMGISLSDYSREWSFEIEKDLDNTEEYFDYINYFLNLLEDKYDSLLDLGILRDDISIWHIYGYEDQCNMEFMPKDLERLGRNGITLCISCYQN